MTIKELHIVKSVILEKEYNFNMKNNGKIRVFAINVNSVEEMIFIATTVVTPINPAGFLTYVADDLITPVVTPINPDKSSTYIADNKNAKDAMDRGEKTMVFHEDIGLAYPEKLENVMQKYPNIKFQKVETLPVIKE